MNLTEDQIVSLKKKYLEMMEAISKKNDLKLSLKNIKIVVAKIIGAISSYIASGALSTIFVIILGNLISFLLKFNIFYIEPYLSPLAFILGLGGVGATVHYGSCFADSLSNSKIFDRMRHSYNKGIDFNTVCNQLKSKANLSNQQFCSWIDTMVSAFPDSSMTVADCIKRTMKLLFNREFPEKVKTNKDLEDYEFYYTLLYDYQALLNFINDFVTEARKYNDSNNAILQTDQYQDSYQMNGPQYQNPYQMNGPQYQDSYQINEPQYQEPYQMNGPQYQNPYQMNGPQYQEPYQMNGPQNQEPYQIQSRPITINYMNPVQPSNTHLMNGEYPVQNTNWNPDLSEHDNNHVR